MTITTNAFNYKNQLSLKYFLCFRLHSEFHRIQADRMSGSDCSNIDRQRILFGRRTLQKSRRNSLHFNRRTGKELKIFLLKAVAFVVLLLVVSFTVAVQASRNLLHFNQRTSNDFSTVALFWFFHLFIVVSFIVVVHIA
jgi:hypothetical protein